MEGCGFCDGTVSMISLNDDGKTYTIHLHENDTPVDVQVDFKTLSKLGSAIQIQMLLSDRKKYVPFEEPA